MVAGADCPSSHRKEARANSRAANYHRIGGAELFREVRSGPHVAGRSGAKPGRANSVSRRGKKFSALHDDLLALLRLHARLDVLASPSTAIFRNYMPVSDGQNRCAAKLVTGSNGYSRSSFKRS